MRGDLDLAGEGYFRGTAARAHATRPVDQCHEPLNEGWPYAPAPEFPRAACAGEDPELWFPVGNADHKSAQLAKGICAECPHVIECRDWAVAERVKGIWGGTSETERELMRSVAA